jgi:hypothetical protein
MAPVIQNRQTAKKVRTTMGFQARFPGQCAFCHKDINVGDEVDKVEGGSGYRHVDCAPPTEKWAVTPPVDGCDHENGFLSMSIRGVPYLVCPDCSAKFEGKGVPVQFRGQENDDSAKHYKLFAPRDCVGCKKYRGKTIEELWAIHIKWIDTGVEDFFAAPEPEHVEAVKRVVSEPVDIPETPWESEGDDPWKA